MRRLWQLAVVLLVTAVLVPLIAPLKHRLATPLLRREAPADFADHQVGIGYVLTDDQWTVFSLPPGADRLRLLVNGSWTGSLPVPEARFALAYECKDESDTLLGQDTLHFRSVRTLYRGEDGREQAAVSFEERDRPALDLRTTPLQPPPGTTRIRLKLADADPGVADAVLRLYGPNTLTPGTEQVAWQRLRQIEKRRLARATLEDYRFLPDREIAALVRQVWRPLGPDGVKDRDYRVRRVFTLRENPPSRADTTPPDPEVPVVGPGRVITIPLPEQQGCVTLTLRQAPDAPFSVPSVGNAGEARIIWILHRRGERPQRFSEPFLMDRESVIQHDLQEGDRFIEVLSDRPALVTATVNGRPLADSAEPTAADGSATPPMPTDEAQQAYSITPPLLRVETWRTRSDQPLEFGLHGSADSDTPLRLSLFALPIDFDGVDAAGDRLPEVAAARLVFFDSAGRTLDEKRLSWHPQASRYDYLAPLALGVPLGEAWQRVFHCPPGTRRVVVYTDSLVQVALRPNGLPLVRNIPADYADYQSGARPVPLWFPLQPRDAEVLRRLDAVQWIVRQPRPPELNADLLAGRSWNEALLLEPAGPGRMLWLPAQRNAFFEPRAVAGAFVPLMVNQPQKVVLYGGGRSWLEPTLLFTRPSGRGRVQVFLDGRHQQTVQTSATQGVLTLPRVQPGALTVEVAADPQTRLYLNYRFPESDYVQQVFTRALQQPLSVLVEKQKNEAFTLAVAVFSPRAEPGSSVISTRLEEAAPRQIGETFTPRFGRYRVAPSEQAALGADAAYDAGRRFYVPFGDDLPPGRYRLWLSRESGPEVLVRVTRLQSLAGRPTGLRAAPAP